MSLSKAPTNAHKINDDGKVDKKAHDTSTSTADLISFGHIHITWGINRLTEGIMSSGNESFVEYEGGKKLLDFTCGIGVTSLGSEAIEAGMKMARITTGRQHIICMQLVEALFTLHLVHVNVLG
ncbi:hypothetical protein C0991_000366 [Blastosporella zonata]|nr:hypothetical protein C0991_000366 [Blastosporella zonata]